MINFKKVLSTEELKYRIVFLKHKKKLVVLEIQDKIFDTKIVVAKINPRKFLWFYFCNIIFCIKIFCITVVCVTNIGTFIFDSKETTLAGINVQNFVTQKMLMQNFLSQKKTRAKINRQKYMTI